MKSIFKLANTALLAALLGGMALSAQTLDNSGNGLLKGPFKYRQVAILNYDQNGFVTRVGTTFGTITFDGNGNYTISGNSVDNTISNGAVQSFSVTGTYVIGANGAGYIANPLAPTTASDRIYGAVAQGIFSGSATEETNIFLNDILVAIPAGTPTNASFNSPYWLGVIDFTAASDASVKNAMFQIAPNGNGSLGALSITGQDYNATNNPETQNISGATYTFASDGTGTLTVPAPSGVSSANAALFAPATKTMFVSSNGNFVLGWTPTGYDIFFGVKSISGATDSMFQGLYYTSAMEDTSSAGVDTFSGSIWSARGDGSLIVHQRVSLPVYIGYAIDYVSDNYTQLSSNGTTSDVFGFSYAFGPGAQSFVAVGSGGYFSLTIGTHANSFSGSGVYLNPIGVFDAASYAPITASLAPGELITLFGSGLAGSTTSAQGGQVFPTTLGGVQVTINGVACAIYFVSPNQISVIVPYGLTSSVGDIQVINNGQKSNVISMYTTDALPGVFSQDLSGIGLAAAVHPSTGALITPTNPAKPGETISVFLTGLGTVSPALSSDGALGGTNPLNQSSLFTSGNLFVFFNDYDNNSTANQATITYAGLAPGLAGLYQLNVTVPSSNVGPCIPSSTAVGCYLEFDTDYATVNQVQIPVAASGAAATEKPLSRTGAPRRSRLPARLQQ